MWESSVMNLPSLFTSVGSGQRHRTSFLVAFLVSAASNLILLYLSRLPSHYGTFSVAEFSCYLE